MKMMLLAQSVDLHKEAYYEIRRESVYNEKEPLESLKIVENLIIKSFTIYSIDPVLKKDSLIG